MDLTKTNLKVLSIIGSKDGLAKLPRYNQSKKPSKRFNRIYNSWRMSYLFWNVWTSKKG